MRANCPIIRRCKDEDADTRKSAQRDFPRSTVAHQLRCDGALETASAATRDFPPAADKTIRRFSSAEAAKFIGITEGYLRQLISEGKGPSAPPNARRSYSLEDIETLRRGLDTGNKVGRRYIPRRRDGEALQVISVMNFKGGSGKTTTSAHLAQYLAFRGYRVLAIDLDPQASLSALLGISRSSTSAKTRRSTARSATTPSGAEMPEIIRATYFPNLDIVPGNLELMEFEHETPKALLDAKSDESLFFASMDAGPGARSPTATMSSLSIAPRNSAFSRCRRFARRRPCSSRSIRRCST